jgi:hypothetical protein
MKYNKQIKIFYNSIKNNLFFNKQININKIKNSIIKYKLFKKYIKKYSIKNNNEYSNELCSICIETLEYNYVKLKCNHSYHLNCIINSLKYNNSTCALCRSHIISNNSNNHILQILSMFYINIDSIESIHNIIEYIIKNKIIKYNKIKLYIRNKKKLYNNSYKSIIKMKHFLYNYDKINYFGIKKIIKKIKKKLEYNIDFIINDYINNFNFIKIIKNL